MKNQENSPENQEKYKFILFTSGMAIKSLTAIENFKKIGDEHLKGNYELEIIDVNKQKHQAVNYQIVALPTLIKLEPQPKRVIIGDLSDTQKVLQVLNLV